jgi:hypothetical protein
VFSLTCLATRVAVLDAYGDEAFLLQSGHQSMMVVFGATIAYAKDLLLRSIGKDV